MILANLVKLKLVLHSLTDHILQLMNIAKVNSTGLLGTSLSTNNDRHDQRLLMSLSCSSCLHILALA